MNFYDEIKHELINNEVVKRAKDYSRNRSDLTTYYNVGRLIVEAQGGEARAKYGDGLIKEYSKRLTKELGKNYDITTLKRMRQFYCIIEKGAPLEHQLSWSHYKILLAIKDIDKIKYYINQVLIYNLSKRQLTDKIKNQEYERLDDKTKEKLIKNEEIVVSDFIKNPIIIRSNLDYDDISEKMLKQLILEDMDNFLTELGEGFCYIKNEYPIKLGDKYNYLDMLLYNIKFNCYVVLELKVVELKAEHIGQIQKYMNYIDKNLRTINQDKTIGIIIVKKDNKYVMEYCSDERIYRSVYLLKGSVGV